MRKKKEESRLEDDTIFSIFITYLYLSYIGSNIFGGYIKKRGR